VGRGDLQHGRRVVHHFRDRRGPSRGVYNMEDLFLPSYYDPLRRIGTALDTGTVVCWFIISLVEGGQRGQPQGGHFFRWVSKVGSL
jgi:hypothetical protein